MLITIRQQDAAPGAGGADYCRQLEAGNILFLPHARVGPSADERDFLFGFHGAVAASHKNIAYMPRVDRLTGLSKRRASDEPALRGVLRTHAARVTQLVTTLLPPYAAGLRVDYTSFRPEEEEGRTLRRRSRNDLLHTDAFPSRPTNGDRILRVFTNINPHRARCWVTTDGFEELLGRFANTPGIRLPSSSQQSGWRRTRHFLRARAPVPVFPMLRRSPYDDFMLRFHNFLKTCRAFQAACPKQTWDFPPDSTWIVFTDMVPHAVLSGQHALEQTFLLARAALVAPEKAPINVLERRCGGPLTNPARKE